MNEYLTTAQAAPLLDLDATTVRGHCQRGAFPGAFQEAPGKLWRIPRETVEGRYDTAEAAEYLGIAESTVRKWAADGRFPHAISTGTGRGRGWLLLKRDLDTLERPDPKGGTPAWAISRTTVETLLAEYQTTLDNEPDNEVAQGAVSALQRLLSCTDA